MRQIVVLSDAGEVALVKAQPDAYHELGRVQAIEGKCWSTPALSDVELIFAARPSALALT